MDDGPPPEAPRRTSARTVAVHVLVLLGAVAGAVGEQVASERFNLPSGEAPGGLVTALAALALVSVARIVRWASSTYLLTTEGLVVRTGVVRREVRTARYDRIQQVASRRQLLDQLLGLEQLRVDVAGEADAGVTLQSLTPPEAERVRAAVERRRTHPGGVAPVAGPPLAPPTAPLGNDAGPLEPPGSRWREVRRYSAPQLLVVALAQPVVVLALAALAVATPVGVVVTLGRVAEQGVSLRALGGLVGTGVVGLVVVVASVVSGLLSRRGLVVDTDGGRLLRTRSGLLERREVRLPRHRVHRVVVTRTPLHLVVGAVDVELSSARSLQGGGAALEIPLVPLAEAGSLVGDLLADPGLGAAVDAATGGRLQGRPPAAARRAVLRRVVIASLPGLAVAALAWPVGVLALPVAALGVPWGRLAHRRAGWGTDGTHVVLSAGALVHRTEVVVADRLQSTATSASPLARRAGLASVRADVAGSASPARLADLAAADAARLAALVAAEPVAGPG